MLAKYLSQHSQHGVRVATHSPTLLKTTLKKGDVLLVEGSSRFSVAIKYLTQSTWSHSALYIGDAVDSFDKGEKARLIVEADIQEGIRLMPLSIYYYRHTRICRPVGLTSDQIDKLVDFAVSREGDKYDLKNVFDLARYFIQRPPVPAHWRRRLLAFGSGDPTRAICSSLIAQAFHSVGYPILPDIVSFISSDPDDLGAQKDYAHIRHHSLFAPSDFDLSPYFDIIKPTVEHGFDPSKIIWTRPDEINAKNESR